MTYSEKLKDPRWQKKRLEVLQRDGFKCLDCGDGKKTLNVHHCAYVGRDPWLVPDSVLMTLCHECHENRQEMENDAHLMLGQIMAKMPHDQVQCGFSSELGCWVTELSCMVSHPIESPTIIAFDRLIDLHKATEGAGK